MACKAKKRYIYNARGSNILRYTVSFSRQFPEGKKIANKWSKRGVSQAQFSKEENYKTVHIYSTVTRPWAYDTVWTLRPFCPDKKAKNTMKWSSTILTIQSWTHLPEDNKPEIAFFLFFLIYDSTDFNTDRKKQFFAKL